MTRLQTSRRGLKNADRPTLTKVRCVRDHSLIAHGFIDAAGYLRCRLCLRASQRRYNEKKRGDR